MRRALYVGTVLGLLLGITMIDFFILKELREFRNETNAKLSYEIPELKELAYFDKHKVKIGDMEELDGLNDCLVLFYSDDCTMCDITKKDIAAFIYYGLTNIVDIYFVDIDENENVIGETFGEELKEQRIYGTPSVFELKEHKFKRYEGVDEIYNLLNKYAEI